MYNENQISDNLLVNGKCKHNFKINFRYLTNVNKNIKIIKIWNKTTYGQYLHILRAIQV